MKIMSKMIPWRTVPDPSTLNPLYHTIRVSQIQIAGREMRMNPNLERIDREIKAKNRQIQINNIVNDTNLPLMERVDHPDYNIY